VLHVDDFPASYGVIADALWMSCSMADLSLGSMSHLMLIWDIRSEVQWEAGDSFD
jgi:hypothetical protein